MGIRQSLARLIAGAPERFPARLPQRLLRPVRAVRYDSAQTTDDNRKHWTYADGLSAGLSLSPAVRQLLRNRARYEVANNTYAKGIILTLANDAIGNGPHLQATGENPALNTAVEAAWADWCDAVRLADKLNTMRQAKATDGEAFAVLHRYDGLPGPVKLGVRLVEAEQVATPMAALPVSPYYTDGIEFDDGFEPALYHVLKAHPTEIGFSAYQAADKLPARYVLHWFRQDRPGQFRGAPEIAPALPLFAQLRRYTLAVIAAAETAADFAAVIQTQAPANGEDAADAIPFDTVELEARMATVLPAGATLGQIRAEQPATTYREFKAEILNEIARVLNMPLNIALCNSSAYNYASGRLDHQTYDRSIAVDRDTCETVVLTKCWAEWYAEARRVIPALRGAPAALPHQWMWQSRPHIDPSKEATGQETRLRNHTTTLAAEYAQSGKDWEAEIRQAARELALMKDLGLPAPGAAPAATTPPDESDTPPGQEPPQ